MTTPDEPLPVEPEPLSWVTGVDAQDEDADDSDDGVKVPDEIQERNRD